MNSAVATQLTSLVLAKIEEQINCLYTIVARLPVEKVDWQPELPPSIPAPPRSVRTALGHLLDCLAGFVAVLYAANPDWLEFVNQIDRSMIRPCGITEALERIHLFQRYIRDGFQPLTDNQLGCLLSTVFVPEGEAVLTLLLGNLEHLINHKHEIFTYAKLLGIPVTTRDLYAFRAPPPH